MNNLLIQLIGFVGMGFLALSFQQNNRNRILLFILTGQLIFLVHFVLLGAWTAVAMNSVGAVRTILFRYKDVKRWGRSDLWPVLFIAAFIGSGLIAWQGWYSILPIVAMSIETVGLWMKHPRRIRMINLFPHPLWFYYNMLQGSWPGVLTEILVFASILIGIIRFDLKKRKGI